MSELLVLQEGRSRRTAHRSRARPSRLRHFLLLLIAVLVASLVALLAFMAARASGPGQPALRAVAKSRAPAARPAPHRYGSILAPRSERLRISFKLRLRAGLLFDVRTGRVLWERDAQRLLPIASLTKMMTALVVVSHTRPRDQVLISWAAIRYSGSGVGLLPLHKHVSVLSLLYGLMLPSGNDAAISLAEHVGRSQGRFVAMMNARAREMRLRCTHFTSPSGIADQGNYSCASDLAIIAHAVLKQPLLARIVSSRSAVLPFPIKGGKLYLYNNNPLLVLRYRGADGVKTGFTNAAGRCLVATARRGRTWLGVVLLHSADPPDQAQKLLNSGFAALRR